MQKDEGQTGRRRSLETEASKFCSLRLSVLCQIERDKYRERKRGFKSAKFLSPLSLFFFWKSTGEELLGRYEFSSPLLNSVPTGHRVRIKLFMTQAEKRTPHRCRSSLQILLHGKKKLPSLHPVYVLLQRWSTLSSLLVRGFVVESFV